MVIIVKRIIPYIYTSVIWFIVMIPLGFLLVNSFRSTGDLLRGFINMPRELTLENYITIIVDNNGLRYLINSIIVTAGSIILSFVITPYFAFLITIRWSGKTYRILYTIIASCMFIPENVLLFPLIKVFYTFHLMNYAGLFLYYAVFLIPGNLFILVPYFKTVDKDILCAAQLDGCSEINLFYRVFLPIFKPIITTVLIINTIWIWNDFLLPLLVLSKTPELWTIPIFIYNYVGRGSFGKNLAFSACQLALLPIIVFYGVFNKIIMNGLKYIK